MRKIHSLNSASMVETCCRALCVSGLDPLNKVSYPVITHYYGIWNLVP